MNLSYPTGSILLLLLSSSANAQFIWDRQEATEKEKMGYICSAQLYILTGGDAGEHVEELQRNAQAGGMLFSQLAAHETTQRTQEGLTHGDVISIRDQELNKLKSRIKADLKVTKNESHYCLKWVSEVRAALMENQDITPDKIPVLDNTSVPEPSDSQTRYVDSAFENWKELEYITPSDFKEELRKELQ